MKQELIWMLRNARRQLRGTPQSWRNDLAQWKKFWCSYRQYCQMTPVKSRPSMGNLVPCLGDDTNETPVEPTYFYQDAWAFERIVNAHPPQHIDIGSHHKFVALLSKVVPVIMVDRRPLALALNSLCFREGSILELPFPDGSVGSLSSLCVVEHIGLGRYGDPLDWQGTEKAIAELKRVIAPNGDLYLSLPLDDENRTYFNAHRAFKEEYLMKLFEPFDVVERKYIYGQEFLSERQRGFGTGCYHLKRPA